MCFSAQASFAASAALTALGMYTIFKIKNKGLIKEGYDADLVIVDLDKRQAVRNDDLLTKCKWSSFEGKILKGWPVTTIVNGNVVYDKGEIFDVKGKEIVFSK